MGKALYRKYRSKSLDEVVGQEHITDTLRRAIKSGRVSHAYLFTGPRGVGKTSIARILAHELNGVEYTGEDNHLDIIEIDAASNGGVEEIRDLREKVYIAPSNGKYKVYIIDEVHMMTTAAFNALLKTLEEPPAHAVFILATTEAHKLPATIVSRTQRFAFKPIEKSKVIAHLRHIATEEKIDITDDALELIAEHGEGSFRDSIGMLDQAGSAGKPVNRDDIEQLLGIPPASGTSSIIRLVAAHDSAQLTQLLISLRQDGYQAAGVAKRLAQELRSQLISGKTLLSQSQIIAILAKLIDVPASHNPDQLLELVLLEAALGPPPPVAAQPSPPVLAASTQPVTVLPARPDPAIAVPPTQEPPKQAVQPNPSALSEDEQPTTGMIGAQEWQLLLDALKKQYNTLYGIIRMAKPDFTPGRVTLTFGFAFHQKRANDAKNKKILSSILEEKTGQRLAIECKYDKTVTPPAPAISPAAAPSPASANHALGAINDVFGGGEVLPS